MYFYISDTVYALRSSCVTWVAVCSTALNIYYNMDWIHLYTVYILYTDACRDDLLVILFPGFVNIPGTSCMHITAGLPQRSKSISSDVLSLHSKGQHQGDSLLAYGPESKGLVGLSDLILFISWTLRALRPLRQNGRSQSSLYDIQSVNTAANHRHVEQTFRDAQCGFSFIRFQ